MCVPQAGSLAPHLADALGALQSLPHSELPARTPGQPLGPRPIRVRAAALPSSGGGARHTPTCLLSGTFIRGPAFTFACNQGEAAVPLSDAIMWAMLHPFAPTHTGERFLPF